MRKSMWVGLDLGKSKLSMTAFTDDRLTFPVAKLVKPADPAGLHETTVSLLHHYSTDFALHIGVASFGPLETDVGSPEYGSIVNPSVPTWAGASICRSAALFTDHPIRFDLDVVAGGIAELALRPEIDGAFYLSVGTGIGGSWVCRDRPPTRGQFGHIQVRRQKGDPFAGSCLFHGDCLQGLASGSALASRWGPDVSTFAVEHAAWQIESRYLADACTMASFLTGGHAIVLGGGVSQQPGLLDSVARRFATATASFDSIGHRSSIRAQSQVVQGSKLGPWSPAVGAAIMARDGLGFSFS